MTYDRNLLDHELRIHDAIPGSGHRNKSFLRIVGKNLLGWMMMALHLTIGDVSWGKYKDDLVSNTDFKKFDGTLRQVISGTTGQREALEGFLQTLNQQGKCVFGIHVSDAALISCMIDSRAGEHYHFVDSAGGGYALAAESLKQQLTQNSG